MTVTLHVGCNIIGMFAEFVPWKLGVMQGPVFTEFPLAGPI